MVDTGKRLCLLLLSVLLSAGAVHAQKGITHQAGDTIFAGWADSNGTGQYVDQTNPKSLCCGSWSREQSIKFNSVDFGATPYKFMLVSYSSGEPGCFLVPSNNAPTTGPAGGSGTSILSNPPTFDAMPIEGSGGWHYYCLARIRMKPVTGIKPLYIYVGRCANTGGTIDLDWVKFTNDSTQTVYWDWTRPVDIPVKPGSGPSTSVTHSIRESGATSIVLTASGVSLRQPRAGHCIVTVTSLSGQLLMRKSLTAPIFTSIPVPALSAGVYLVRMETAGQSVTKSFVIR